MNASVARVSLNNRFLAFLLTDVNEVQIWDISQKSKCLTRLSPTDVNMMTAKARFTCFEFS